MLLDDDHKAAVGEPERRNAGPGGARALLVLVVLCLLVAGVGSLILGCRRRAGSPASRRAVSGTPSSSPPTPLVRA